MRVISEIDAAGKDGNGGKISGHTRCSIFKEFLILILMNGPKTSRDFPDSALRSTDGHFVGVGRGIAPYFQQKTAIVGSIEPARPVAEEFCVYRLLPSTRSSASYRAIAFWVAVTAPEVPALTGTNLKVDSEYVAAFEGCAAVHVV